MDEVNRREPGLGGFKANRRKAVRFSPEDLIKMDYLVPEKRFPMVMEPNAAGMDLVAWAESNREFLERQLLQAGALLFRGFKVEGMVQFEQFARAISGNYWIIV